MRKNQFICPHCEKQFNYGLIVSGPSEPDNDGNYQVELECQNDDCGRSFWAEIKFVSVMEA